MRAEDNFQITVFDYLKRNGIYAFHIKNQGKWSPAYGRKLRQMGRRKGMLDLQCITAISEKLPRGVFMIECKRPPQRLPSGKLSKAQPRLEPEQVEVIGELAALGIPTLIVRSLDELDVALLSLGVSVRARVL
jgi:hypothetical protein